jgi:hypothetical protein
MFTLAFWKAAFERIVASIAGAALAVIGADAFGVLQADWQGIASVALGAGVVALLKALAAGAKDGNPSLTNAETTPGAVPSGITVVDPGSITVTNGGKHEA